MVFDTVTGLFQRSDGAYGHMTSTPNGAVHVQQLGGKYAELARRGMLFNYSVKTAASFVVSATAGSCPTIWNPIGSGKILYIYKLRVNFLSGTTVINSLQWMVTKNAGAGISATAPIVTFTEVASDPALIGAQYASVMRFAPATVSFVAAPSFLSSTGINLGAVSPSAGSGTYEADYDGDIAVMPGNAISLCAAVASTTSLWFATIIGAEMPLVDGK